MRAGRDFRKVKIEENDMSLSTVRVAAAAWKLSIIEGRL
jgi:hypothetical protein